jgi:competence protein ComFC
LAIVAGMRKFGHVLLDLLYPPQCYGCGRAGVLFCLVCRDSVPRLAPPLCDLCGRPQIATGCCPACIDRPMQIDGIRSVALFEGVLRKAIHGLKYENVRGLADILGEMMAEYWRDHSWSADALVPVPLHPRRRRERGYNQSLLLAKRVERAAGVPVVNGVLHRHRYTMSQTHLGATERRQNVAGAFSCADDRLAGKNVVLIDDVCTTGSTLESCSVALYAGGACSVRALTLARASG